MQRLRLGAGCDPELLTQTVSQLVVHEQRLGTVAPLRVDVHQQPVPTLAIGSTDEGGCVRIVRRCRTRCRRSRRRICRPARANGRRSRRGGRAPRRPTAWTRPAGTYERRCAGPRARARKRHTSRHDRTPTRPDGAPPRQPRGRSRRRRRGATGGLPGRSGRRDRESVGAWRGAGSSCALPPSGHRRATGREDLVARAFSAPVDREVHEQEPAQPARQPSVDPPPFVPKREGAAQLESRFQGGTKVMATSACHRARHGTNPGSPHQRSGEPDACSAGLPRRVCGRRGGARCGALSRRRCRAATARRDPRRGRRRRHRQHARRL